MTTMTTRKRTLPTQRTTGRDAGPPGTAVPETTTRALPAAVAEAARENFADVCRFLADLWDAEPGDHWVREDRPSTWLREMAVQALGGPEHHRRHRTGWTT